MDNNVSHVCLGTCQAVISDEEYKKGLIACGAESCTMKGQQFVVGKKCEKCGKNYQADREHNCGN